jgi:hypothetical protein
LQWYQKLGLSAAIRGLDGRQQTYHAKEIDELVGENNVAFLTLGEVRV